MRIEFLLEEPSLAEALQNLMPRIKPEADCRYHAFQGKADLLDKLPERLRAYGKWLPPDDRLVVLVDEDRADCRALKARLEAMAFGAGLSTRSHPRADGRFEVIHRVVVEELEAWFYGDGSALRAAFPWVPATLCARATYRDPDAVKGGTWEALQRVLCRAGYYSAGYQKVDAARRISAHMDPDRNTSRSFCCFRDAVRHL